MNAYGVGGTIRATFTLAGELAKRHDVEIVSVLRTEKRPKLPLDPAVRLRPLTDRRPKPWPQPIARRLAGPSEIMHPADIRYEAFDRRSDIKLRRFLRSVRDGAIVGTRPAINLAIAELAHPSAVRVGQDHMHFNKYDESLRTAIEKSYRRLDAVTALTERTARKYRRALPKRVRVETLPNGVRSANGRRADPNAKVVVAAGRLTRQKAFHRLLRVWADVAPGHPDWELRIFGDGPRHEGLEEKIRKFGLERQARLMGHTPKLGEELAGASIYAMTSRFEGFPMVLLEAMSAGLPVVSYDCRTGPAEIVSHGVDGYVVPNRDRGALAAAMSELMDDAEKRSAFAAAALEKAERYDPALIAERFELLLQELAAAKPPPVSMAKRLVNGALRRLTGHVLVKPEQLRAAQRKRAAGGGPGKGPGKGKGPEKGNGAAKGKQPGKGKPAAPPDHYDAEARELIGAVRDWTMTSNEKLFALITASRYVVDQGIPGAIVECGVWRGGSMQAVARTLLAKGVDDRDLHLFDTFEGMPEPGERDRRHDGAAAAELLRTRPKGAKVWAIAGLDDVRAGMEQTGYPAERVHYHPGRVEETVPAEAPDEIALLRLDTDWYDSTKHELEHLYDRVPSGGVILLDDYGYWEGAREAVDEFVQRTGVRLLLVPMGSGRIAVKP
jgi:O-methyltransferase